MMIPMILNQSRVNRGDRFLIEKVNHSFLFFIKSGDGSLTPSIFIFGNQDISKFRSLDILDL